MNGDFSRRTFAPRDHFSRVLMQQGRVLLDADWNEQVSILLHYLRSAIRDFSGPVAPVGDAFQLSAAVDDAGNPQDDDFVIAPGHLYVDGYLCENDRETAYTKQPHLDVGDVAPITSPTIAYLDVWEQHITHHQIGRIREVALGGPDTTTRARVTWQVRLHDLERDGDGGDAGLCDQVVQRWDDLVERWQSANRGLLQAWTPEPGGFPTDDPCITPPGARYRGLANRLYRVEIHTGGALGDATFTWSRDNGSVVFPIVTLVGRDATVEMLGVGDQQTLAAGAWVEVVDDRTELNDAPFLGKPGQLAQVEFVDAVDGIVELDPVGGSMDASYDERSTTHPLLRRWDYVHGVKGGGEEATDGALLVEEGTEIALEDGIAIRFAPPDGGGVRHTYRTGDYWLIPARTETGDIEWPQKGGAPAIVEPHGVHHHFAPLGVITLGAGGGRFEDCLADLRRDGR